MNFLEVEKLFRKYNLTTYQVLMSNPFFYSKMTRIINNIDLNKIPDILCLQTQIRNKDIKISSIIDKNISNYIGGGKYKISISVSDYIFIDEYNENEQLFFVFYGKNINNNKNDTPCIVLMKENETMHIMEINVFGNYCLTENKKMLNGSQLLSIILNFIDSIKIEHNIKYISLLDKSEKFCGSMNIPLGDFKILLTGESWYEGYGFTPAIIKTTLNKNGINKNITTSQNEIDKYKNNKKIIEHLKVKNSSILEIIKNDMKLYKLDDKEYKSLNELYNFLLVNTNVNLSKVLREYLRPKKFTNRCIGLALIIDELFRKNNLITSKNKYFIMSLKQ